MSNRVAFTPLKSLETTLDPAVQQRARTLFASAKTKTAKGSGNDLDKAIAGNSTAIASACLLLAKIESEGTSNDDLDVHQRHAMVTKAQFKALMGTLQSVLDLQSDAKTAFTPTKGSARKRKAATGEEDQLEPSTPTKTRKHVAPVAGKTSEPSRPSRSVEKRSARTSAMMDELAVTSEQRHRKEDQMEIVASSRPTASASRHSSRPSRTEPASSGCDRTARLEGTPTKSTGKRAQSSVKAEKATPFELALKAEIATASKPTIVASSAKGGGSRKTNIVAPEATRLEETEKAQEETEVPYEPYWGDMLLRFRRQEDVVARRRKAEGWRQAMLKRCTAME